MSHHFLALLKFIWGKNHKKGRGKESKGGASMGWRYGAITGDSPI